MSSNRYDECKNCIRRKECGISFHPFYFQNGCGHNDGCLSYTPEEEVAK